MSFPFYIAKRYLFSKSSNNAINVITIIAAIGIIIGSAALFIVLSGFAGLKDFSLQFSSIIDPELKVIPAKGKSLEVTTDIQSQLQNMDGIASYSKILEERAILNYNDKHQIVTLKGVDSNYPKSTIDSILTYGNWMEPGSNYIVSGWGVTNQLGYGIFNFENPVKILMPKPGKGPVSALTDAFNSIKTINSGVFQINEDLDNNNVYTNLKTAQALLNYTPNQISALEIKLTDLNASDSVRAQLMTLFNNAVIIKNKEQLNDALYKMLNTENLAVYLIFTLVLVIALFNVIGSIIMMILDKKKNLHTLFNLGLTVKEIKRIFFLQGSLMTVFGGVLGLALGVLLIVLQQSFALIMITPSLPYPVALKPINILVVFATISVLGILASKIASGRISKALIGSA
ncbi:MAG: ABC transporter permease [Flavobacteriaceae bacterium]|nr:ABC transporter permease [Flavobacteriaceae bacterium]